MKINNLDMLINISSKFLPFKVTQSLNKLPTIHYFNTFSNGSYFIGSDLDMDKPVTMFQEN